ncbi:MAG: FAD:protein FMN transferase [Patescibacteria group bacterium]
MFNLSFESMGTHWQVSVDVEQLPQNVITDIFEQTNQFDQQYSRFISTSEANKFRHAQQGEYEISETLAMMLQAGQRISILSDGAFDVSVATLFEEIGYDQDYNFGKAPKTIEWKPPKWSVHKTILITDGPIVFDVGGIGKGYWIDQISNILKKHKFMNHLVEGGGDMFGTQKRDGSPWQVAIEYPGKPDTAIGIVGLQNQGLAVSDIFKRAWKNWHHLVNASTGKPVSSMLGNAAISSSTFLADQMTSCLSFAPAENYAEIASELKAEYLIVNADATLQVSDDWKGELFY